MAFRLVACQNCAHLPEQLRLQRAQARGHILVHGGFAAAERCGCGPHRCAVCRDVFAQLDRCSGSPFMAKFPPHKLCCILCGGQTKYSAVCLDFWAGGAILIAGHKNRGAERLRSASAEYPFYLTGQCRRGSLQNCPFFHKPRAPAFEKKRAHFVFVYY